MDDPGDTCLTGAASGATPPPGAAQIPSCVAHRPDPCRRWAARPGYLQLTDAAGNRAGSILYNRPIPASSGVSVTFEQYQYGGNGADGIGFFLVDGSTSLTQTGGLGGSLGYAQRNQRARASTAVTSASGWTPTATSSTTARAAARTARSASSRRPTPTGPIAPERRSRCAGRAAARPATAGWTPRCRSPIANPDAARHDAQRRHGTLRASTLAASKRTVNVQVTPVTAATRPDVIVQVAVHRWRPVGDGARHPGARPNTPSTYKFGFSASTGGINDVHLIRAAQHRHDRSARRASSSRSRSTARGAAAPARHHRGHRDPVPVHRSPTPGEPVTGLFITDDQIATASITCDATSLTRRRQSARPRCAAAATP